MTDKVLNIRKFGGGWRWRGGGGDDSVCTKTCRSQFYACNSLGVFHNLVLDSPINYKTVSGIFGLFIILSIAEVGCLK